MKSSTLVGEAPSVPKADVVDVDESPTSIMPHPVKGPSCAGSRRKKDMKSSTLVGEASSVPKADVVDVDEIPTSCAKVVPPPVLAGKVGALCEGASHGILACVDAGGDNCSQPRVAPIAPLLKVPSLGGNRTFPSDISRHLIAGVDDPRVFGSVVPRRSSVRSSRPSFFPSKVQFSATISKCLPKQDVANFSSAFSRFQVLANGVATPLGLSDCGVPPGASVLNVKVKTILWSLQEVYGTHFVGVSMCDHMNADFSRAPVKRGDYFEMVVMDAVLSRTLNAPRKKTYMEAVDTPVRFQVHDNSELHGDFDAQFRALVVVVPDAAVYYCHRERRKESVGVVNAHIPMDTSWLRFVRNGGRDTRFAIGGYVAKLWPGEHDFFWKIRICRSKLNFLLRPIPSVSSGKRLQVPPNSTRRVICAHQCPDELGPRLPPDVIDGVEHFGGDWLDLRRKYRKAYEECASKRVGCRHYCSGFLHKKIDPKRTLVINPDDGDVDIRISLQILRPPSKRRRFGNGDNSSRVISHVALARDSVVQIRQLCRLGPGAMTYINDIATHARLVRLSRKNRSVRSGLGDSGSMHPIGTRILKDGVTRSRYVTNSSAGAQKFVRKAVVGAASLAAATIPGVMRSMQDIESDGGIAPP
jgi:hypothetical protein